MEGAAVSCLCACAVLSARAAALCCPASSKAAFAQSRGALRNSCRRFSRRSGCGAALLSLRRRNRKRSAYTVHLSRGANYAACAFLPALPLARTACTVCKGAFGHGSARRRNRTGIAGGISRRQPRLGEKHTVLAARFLPKTLKRSSLPAENRNLPPLPWQSHAAYGMIKKGGRLCEIACKRNSGGAAGRSFMNLKRFAAAACSFAAANP